VKGAPSLFFATDPLRAWFAFGLFVRSRRSLARAEAALRRRPWLRLRRPRPTDRVDRTSTG